MRDNHKKLVGSLKNQLKEISDSQLTSFKQQEIESKIIILENKIERYKFISNCIFGFIGGRHSPLNDVKVARSVTKMARNIVLRTKAFIEKCFSKEHNFKSDAKILYGDTDSVFISFGTNDIQVALNLAINAVNLINKFLKFPEPILIRLDHI